MKELQTPHKVTAHSAENHRNGRSKEFPSNKAHHNSLTIMNKSFNAASTSPISDITQVNSNDDVSINTFLFEENNSLTLLPSDITPSDTKGISSTNRFGSVCELEGSKLASVEVEFSLNFLRKVKPEILTSMSASPQYRKLVDEIIEYAIQDLSSNTLPKDVDCFAQALSVKNRLLFLCVFIWFIGVIAVIVFSSDDNHFGPTPT